MVVSAITNTKLNIAVNIPEMCLINMKHGSACVAVLIQLHWEDKDFGYIVPHLPYTVPRIVTSGTCFLTL